MKFLRGLLGSTDDGRDRDAAEAAESRPGGQADDVVPDDEAEREREARLLREEQGGLDDLAQRQQKYARFAWQPPRQGGDRRAEDAGDASGRS